MRFEKLPPRSEAGPPAKASTNRMLAATGRSAQLGVVDRFAQTLAKHQLELRRNRTQVLQLNVGKRCNLTCTHCHVNAGPGRKELMTRTTLNRILDWLAPTDIPTVDITGGAPEMLPDFRHLIQRVKAMSPSRHVMDRCNLTILLEPGYETLPEFLAQYQVEIIASLPCYSAKNVNEQRGDGVFDSSIHALHRLNALGYGIQSSLPLHLVYNPNGAFLPGPQAELESDYRRALRSEFGIEFNRLYAITNMPIARFAADLKRQNRLQEYMNLLVQAFNPQTIEGLMCRTTLSVGWQGEVYDCDFNQMLDLQWMADQPLYIWDLDHQKLEGRPILTADHCFGCAAGSGSSCGGTLTR